MPRIMDYYKKINLSNSKPVIKNKKSPIIFNKICKEDGFVRIPDVCSLSVNNLTFPLNPFIITKIKTQNIKQTPVYNKPKVKSKIKKAFTPAKATQAIQEASIITGALSFGINALCFFGAVAARERGYFGSMGGEIFLILGSIYIMFRILKYAQRKDCSKS